MASRVSKQIIIASIYILGAVVIAGGFYWNKYQPTCNDTIQNGKEEGVDCGTVACGKACVAPIQAIVIQDTQLVKTPAGDFDLAVLVYNPNSDYGADAVRYDLVITDSAGTEVLRQADSFYILPGQTKYVVQTSLRGVPVGASARVEIKSVDWIKAIAQDVNFLVNREALIPGTNQTTYEALITNNSSFDFDTVDVGIVVRDSSGSIIATNVTNFQTFLSHTDRSIKVTWPFALPADARIQTEIGTNIFNNANFLKRNGTQEKFQQYY